MQRDVCFEVGAQRFWDANFPFASGGSENFIDSKSRVAKCFALLVED